MIRALLAALLAWATCTPAVAEYEVRPPAKYRHPFNGPLRIINSNCPCARDSLACAWREGRRCVIAISPTLKGERRRLNIEHETAHCNGWPAHHPGGVTVRVGG